MSRPSHREALLDAALSVFHRQGFHASGVADVVAEAAVPKGSFYNHFASKEALGAATLERYWANAAGARAILGNQSLAPLERLDRHFVALGITEDGCLVGNFSVELPRGETVRETLMSVWHRWIDEIAACLADGQRDGTVRDDAPAKELARASVALWEGAVLLRRVEGTGGALNLARRNIRRLLAA